MLGSTCYRRDMNLSPHPILEDAIVALVNTVGAWLIVHQFSWLWWS